MKRYPLTEAGAAEKLRELYALSDPLLAAEAASIASNFKTWMKNNFSLTPEQNAYIDGMNTTATTHYGSACSLCFIERLPILLTYPPAPAAPGYTKWTEGNNKIVVSTNANGDLEVSGEMEFVISYKS